MLTHRKIALLTILGLLLTGTLWAREDRLTNTGATPAAEGKVITSTDHNGNTQIEVQVKHMATAESLTPAKTAYVVWVQPKGRQAEIAGLIHINQDLNGSLKATTPYKDFDIWISAEDNPKPESPSGFVILKGSVQRAD